MEDISLTVLKQRRIATTILLLQLSSFSFANLACADPTSKDNPAAVQQSQLQTTGSTDLDDDLKKIVPRNQWSLYHNGRAPQPGRAKTAMRSADGTMTAEPGTTPRRQSPPGLSGDQALVHPFKFPASMYDAGYQKKSENEFAGMIRPFPPAQPQRQLIQVGRSSSFVSKPDFLQFARSLKR